MSLREQTFAGLRTSGRSAGPGEHAAPAVFIGASPMNLFESKRRARRAPPRARAHVLPETAETLKREV